MTDTAMSRWLREEMPKRNYPLAGPRAGGITRLAKDTGISQAAMSRVVNGQQEPTVAILRKIGALFGVPFGEMLLFAGLAEQDEMSPAVLYHPGRRDWDRVGAMLTGRRQSLGDVTPHQLAEDVGLESQVVVDLELGRNTSYPTNTIAVAEVGYRLAPGSIGQALVDASLTEFPNRLGHSHVGLPRMQAGRPMTVDENGVTVPPAPDPSGPPDDLPGHLLWDGMPDWERDVWHLRRLTVTQRQNVVAFLYMTQESAGPARQVASERRDQTG